MFQNNFPQLQKLDLDGFKRITNAFPGKSIDLANPFLNRSVKFPPILYLLLPTNYSDLLNYFLFETLIKLKSVKLKCLGLYFMNGWNSTLIPTFFKFLKVSNIQFLELHDLEYTQRFDSEEFCEFLRNSKFLQGQCLYSPNEDDFNAGLILQALSFNKSIKVLYLGDEGFSKFLPDLKNLLISNQAITILSLLDFDIEIDCDFINALSKNKSVLYLDLSGSNINEKNALALTELNLKGIRFRGIPKSIRDIIYKKIPKLVLHEDIYKCEEFLKEKKVN